MTAQVTLLDQGNNPTGTAGNPLAVQAVGPNGALAQDASVQAVVTAVQQLHADITGTNSALATINTAVGNVTSAVNAVTAAVNNVQTAVSAGDASAATIAAQTASLTSALSNLQALATTGNAALGTLHTDGINLQGLVSAGNAALAAIQSATQAGSTAANQATMNAALASLNAAATTEIASLNTIATNITSLGGGATLAQIVTALNPLATSADILALQTALSTLDGNELTQLTAIAANQPSLNADGGALAHVTNFPAVQQVALPTGQAQQLSSTPVAISFEQFRVLVDLLVQLHREVAVTNSLLAQELRVKDDLSALRQDATLLN
ncbi:hypothetical protein AAGS40_23295 [Paraburkholderia sp. PREW-6R]|uniref:hypothetical protein n=1 Tax=Paraburkholderia sp. PREW-6R TaxID=3141544 RepID=UPI0031F5705B